MSVNKNVGYFYENENFMADTILKLIPVYIRLNKAYLAVLSFGIILFPWLDLPYCRN